MTDVVTSKCPHFSIEPLDDNWEEKTNFICTCNDCSEVGVINRSDWSFTEIFEHWRKCWKT